MVYTIDKSLFLWLFECDMQKIFRAAFVLFGLCFASAALASSGACSGHGGVNCAAGSDYDGSVVCYDGWTGSSVLYSSMDSCRSDSTSIKISCAPFYATDCLVDDVRASCARQGLSGVCQAQIDNCQRQADAYTKQKQEYDQCMSNLINSVNLYQPISNPSTVQVPVDTTIYSDAFYETQCENKIGPTSKYDPVTKSCVCLAGYQFNSTKTTCSLLVQSPATPAPSEPIRRNLADEYSNGASAANSVIDKLKEIRSKKIEPTKKFVTTSRRINVRSTGSFRSKILGNTTIKKQYELLDQKGDWIKIQFGSKNGWILKKLSNSK